MLAGNRDHFIILLPFLGLLVEVVGLVEVAHGFRVARVNILLQNDVGFLRFSRILIFQKFLKIPDKILLPRCSETETRIILCGLFNFFFKTKTFIYRCLLHLHKGGKSGGN